MAYVCALGPFLKPYYEGGIMIMRSITPTNKEHLTVSYRDAPFEDIEALEYWQDNIEVEVTGEDMFGEKNDIPVYRVRFVDDRVAEKVRRFHDFTEYRKEFKPAHYQPHITRKHLVDQLAVGEHLWAARIFIKRVGSDDVPVYERSLNPILAH